MNERAGQREKIDNTVRQMVNHGMDPKVAKEKARQSAIRDDKRKSAKQ
tara:strand:- start:1744 stop:1887 length:144 start_codon:yes stop_codon:yes gene_type:complete